jgi:hypothetical protein
MTVRRSQVVELEAQWHLQCDVRAHRRVNRRTRRCRKLAKSRRNAAWRIRIAIAADRTPAAHLVTSPTRAARASQPHQARAPRHNRGHLGRRRQHPGAPIAAIRMMRGSGARQQRVTWAEAAVATPPMTAISKATMPRPAARTRVSARRLRTVPAAVPARADRCAIPPERAGHRDARAITAA